MALLRWIIALPFIVGAVLFALSNSEKVFLTYSPFHDSKEFPLYFIGLTFLGIGFLLGAFMAWMGMGQVRKDRRQYKKEVKNLTKENEKLAGEITTLEAELKERDLEKALKVIDVDHE